MFRRKPIASDSRTLAIDAARWLARRDRGLSPAEQDDYLQWLQQDPRHGAAVARHEATVRRMMQLAAWEPGQSDEPNPDLFMRPQRRFFGIATMSTAAAALLIGSVIWFDREPVKPDIAAARSSLHVDEPIAIAAANSFLRVNERQELPDGSVVELKDGSRITVEYTETERRVQLAGGEAHFIVAKNPSHPFLVQVGEIVIRAVGTAFNVRLGDATVEVMVTEGAVQVGDLSAESADDDVATAASPPVVSAGHRAVVELGTPAREARVARVSPEEIEQTLSWQAPRLQFVETPLADAIAEFNRNAASRNGRRLVLGDPAIGALRIGGSCRVNNVDAFVHLVEVTLNLRAEKRGTNEIVLHRAR